MDQASKIRQWFIQGYPYSGALVLVVTLLLIINSSFWINQSQTRIEHQALTQNFTRALGELASENLALALSNKDLISLQALLNQLIEQDAIYSAAVFNVENEIQVQANRSNASPELLAQASLTNQALSLDGNLLGSLQIAAYYQSRTSYFFILFVNLLLAVSAILLGIRLKKIPFNFAMEQTAHTQSPIKTQPVNLKKQQSYLVIYCSNLAQIYRQVSGETRKQYLQQLQTAIEQILTLYSGKQLVTTNHSVVLAFEDTQAIDCLFKAICSGHLLTTLASKQQWLLKISATACIQPESLTDKILLRGFSAETESNGLCVNTDCLSTDTLRERLETAPGKGQHLTQITGFVPPYKGLLENQLQRLLLQGSKS